tara:strand:- start:39 stop:503 length:465 start_codon:yes stop_codon:yes gene_type:complete
MCCKVLGIDSGWLKKPANEWCSKCDKGKGCTVYDERPEDCREFECLWLVLAKDPECETPSLSLRPDKSKVVLYPQEDGETVTAHVDPGNPTAWRKPEMMGMLKKMAANGLNVIVGSSTSKERVLLKEHKGYVVAKTLAVVEEAKGRLTLKEKSK